MTAEKPDSVLAFVVVKDREEEAQPEGTSVTRTSHVTTEFLPRHTVTTYRYEVYTSKAHV